MTQAIGAFEATMDRYSVPTVKAARRQMLIATTDFPFKQGLFRTAFRAANAFSQWQRKAGPSRRGPLIRPEST
jgi:hypothetical protein